MQHFSMAQAAKLCGVSRPTIAKAIKEGRIKALKNDEGWSIPLDQLLAAGFNPGKVSPPEKIQEPSLINHEILHEELHATSYKQQYELSLLKQEVKHLQQMLDERGKTIDYLQLSLRALTSIPSAVQPTQEVSETISKHRKKWWGR